MKREFSSVQFSPVWLFATTWIAARQASLSITNSWSLLKLMSIESVMPSNHLIPSCPFYPLPLIFPTSGSFPMSRLFESGGQSIGALVSASATVLPVNIQSWFPLGLIGLISLLTVQFSHSVMSDSLQTHGLQHAKLPCPSPTPGTCTNSCPSSRWCHPTISSSVVPFSSCLRSFPASGFFLMSQFVTSGS